MALTEVLEKRADFKDDQWENFADAYHSFDRQVDLLPEGDLRYLHERMRKDFPIDRYLTI